MSVSWPSSAARIAAPATRRSAFVRPRGTAQPEVRVVVFHHAGGSSGGYFRLHQSLPEGWDLLLHDLPGHGRLRDEPCLATVQAMVHRAMRDLEGWTQCPIALFGHSLGAIVAHQLAVEMQSRDQGPVWLGVSGRAAPCERHPAFGVDKLSNEGLMRRLRALGGVPAELHRHRDFAQSVAQVARTDLRAVEAFRAASNQAPLNCPLAAFAGTCDPVAPPSQMLPWKNQTRARFELHEFEGGHFYFSGHSFGMFADMLFDRIGRAL